MSYPGQRANITKGNNSGMYKIDYYLAHRSGFEHAKYFEKFKEICSYIAKKYGSEGLPIIIESKPFSTFVSQIENSEIDEICKFIRINSENLEIVSVKNNLEKITQ